MPDIFEIAEGFRAALLKNERAAAVRLVKAYGAAWNRISADMVKLSKQIDAARSRGEIVDQWWLIRQERYRSLLDQITREMSRFADFAESQITAEQLRAIAAARNDAQRLLIAAVGDAPEALAPSFNRLPASAVENLAGFLSNGSPLNRLLGEFAPSARQQIEQGLMDAIAQGFGARKTATAIRKALGGNLVRALRIARTETIRAYRETTHRTFQSNADVMDGWYWLSARNARTCPTCWALHGTFHPITERLAGHVQCRCTQMPRPKSLAELGFPGAPDTRPAVKRGEDLFADQPADVQQQVLGAAFAAYRDGRIRLTDLVGRKESPQWGVSYYTLGVGRALNNEGRFPGYQEPPKPAPPVVRPMPAAFAAPAGIPVDRALKLPSRGAVRNAARNALSAIARVHGDGNLPEIPVEKETSVKRLGGYHYFLSGKPLKITIRPGDFAHPEMTAAHEIGHFLDHQGAGKGKHASVVSDDFEEFRNAASQSKAIQEIERLIKARKVTVKMGGGDELEYPVDVKYLRYLTDTKEVWARAYAQYIAQRSGDAEMQSQLKQLRQRLGQVYYPSQWDDDDFAPIADAIDRLMLKLGWRK